VRRTVRRSLSHATCATRPARPTPQHRPQHQARPPWSPHWPCLTVVPPAHVRHVPCGCDRVRRMSFVRNKRAPHTARRPCSNPSPPARRFLAQRGPAQRVCAQHGGCRPCQPREPADDVGCALHGGHQGGREKGGQRKVGGRVAPGCVSGGGCGDVSGGRGRRATQGRGAMKRCGEERGAFFVFRVRRREPSASPPPRHLPPPLSLTSCPVPAASGRIVGTASPRTRRPPRRAPCRAGCA